MRLYYFTTVFHPRLGGMSVVSDLLCQHLVAAGHEVVLATLTPRGDHDDLALPYTVERSPSVGRWWRLLRWCDLHIQANVSLYAIWAGTVKPRSVIYRHDNGYLSSGPGDWRARLKATVARRVPGIAVSSHLAQSVGCKHAIANPYDNTTFCNKTRWTERSASLAFVGRLSPDKGCMVLLKALARLSRQGLQPRVTLVGDGNERKPLEQFVLDHGLAGQVVFKGRLESRAVATELNRHRILVVPSFSEAFGIVALEGLACGCLPIVSSHTGLVEAIGPHGLLFRKGDVDALADAIGSALAFGDARPVLLDGVEEHLRSFEPAIVAQRYIELFEEYGRR